MAWNERIKKRKEERRYLNFLLLLDGVSSFCLKARLLCPWKTPTSPTCIAEVKVTPAFPSKIPLSSSLLSFPAFFCPEFYNSAVRNCFWAETWQQKSDFRPGMIPPPLLAFKTFSLGQIWGAEEQSGGGGQRGALGTGAGWLRLLSSCFSGSLFFQQKQGWFLHNVAGIFLCVCLHLSRKRLSHFFSKAILLCEPLTSFLVLHFSLC